jgi:hypothetical protein
MGSLTPRCRNLALASLAASGAVLPGLALAASAPKSSAPAVHHSVLQSRLLWATIDVCSPPDQPDTVGIRGSMPGDGHPHDTLYMSFRLQYESGSGNNASWSNLGAGGSSGFISVGGGGTSRQAGRSFTLVPVPGKHSTLRGVVAFQWRRSSKVMRSVERTTTAGHISQTGADPKSYTAATCAIS